jgi:hypothetical protein
MKNLLLYTSLITLSIFFFKVNAQEVLDSTKINSKTYIIIKNDGAQYVGKIITQNEREILIETIKLGKIYIPKYEIKKIEEIGDNKLNKNGELIPPESFSSRYFITTNGLPLNKGDNYIQWNLYGPDFQFGVAKNLNIGIMTSWLGVPIIGNAKYSIGLSEYLSLGVGALLGTGSWAQLNWGLLLPFSCITIGNKKNNLTFSGGYGVIFDKNINNGHLLLSVAGSTKLGDKISFVFDSFIVPKNKEDSYGFALFLPGIRWQMDSKKAFQFGFAAIQVEGKLAPLPIPMIQWYRKL